MFCFESNIKYKKLPKGGSNILTKSPISLQLEFKDFGLPLYMGVLENSDMQKAVSRWWCKESYRHMNMIFNMVVTVSVSTLDCDFDESRCTWVQGETDDFDWTRNTGSTGSYGTGPNGDHTSGKNELSREKLFRGFRLVSTKAEQP